MSSGVVNPFRFAGQHGVQDDLNGVFAMRARSYVVSAQRFLTMDLLQGVLEDPLTLNRSNYATGNPLSGVDPTGMCDPTVASCPYAASTEPIPINWKSGEKFLIETVTQSPTKIPVEIFKETAKAYVKNQASKVTHYASTATTTFVKNVTHGGRSWKQAVVTTKNVMSSAISKQKFTKINIFKVGLKEGLKGAFIPSPTEVAAVILDMTPMNDGRVKIEAQPNANFLEKVLAASLDTVAALTGLQEANAPEEETVE